MSCCVVELGDPPPGVEVSATWYRKNQSTPLAHTRPYVTTAALDQRAVFKLTFGRRHTALTPGHYSVVVDGKNLVREERTFEVLPYSRAQMVSRAVQSVCRKAAQFFQKYHLTHVVVTLGMTVLLALAFLLADIGLAHILGVEQRSGDPILRIGHGISQPGFEGGLGWLAFGAAYAVLHTRHVKRLAKAVESRIYAAINLLLVFAGGALAWYLASYLVFGAGHLWPDKLFGLFEKLLWLNPVVAWLAPVVGLGLVEWHRQEDKASPFHLGPLRAAIGVAGLTLIGGGSALIGGLLAGLLGVVIGSLLGASGVNNNLGRGFFAFGAGLGFVFGCIETGLYAIQEDLRVLWHEWAQKKQEPASPRLNMLGFLVEENIIPGEARDYLLAASVSLRTLLVIGVAIPVLLIGQKPVVLPVLQFFYAAPDDHAFEHAITAAPLAVTAAIALLMAWPVLVFGIYRRMLSPLLSADEAAFARGFRIAALAPAGIIPITILLAGEPIMSSGLKTEVGIFWTNRAAALVLLVWAAVWLALLLSKLPGSRRSSLNLDASSDEITLVVIAILAGILLPGWMWALLLIVAMGIASSAYLLQRID
jgi:hypothetical protein